MSFRPGDIVEVETEKGLAYVQVTHNHASYPEVIRALPGLHRARPAALQSLAQQKSCFSAMIPLQAAIGHGSLKGERCGNAPVPEDEKTFPTFKMAIRDKAGNIAYWWFWDGEGLRYDANPDAETEALPSREVMSAKALLARLENAEAQPAP